MPKTGKNSTVPSQENQPGQRTKTHAKPAVSPSSNSLNFGMADRMKSWLPTDHKSFFFELVVLVCLVISVITFAERGDTNLILHVLDIVAGYVGIERVASLLSKWKGKDQ